MSRGKLSPGADGCGFFPLLRSGAVGSRCRVLTSLPDAGAVRVSRHHTRMEALSPGRPRVQRAGSLALCGLATSPCPPAVRRQGALPGARAPVRCRRGCGAAHVHQVRRSPHLTEPARVSPQRRKAQGVWPMRSGAVMAAGHWAFESAMPRRPPGVSREASGSRAPRTPDRETCVYHRPCDVGTCHRPHGLTSGPRRSTRGPGPGSCRVGSETCGWRDWPGATGRRLLRTPLCERRGPSWGPRSRTVCPPMLGCL